MRIIRRRLLVILAVSAALASCSKKIEVAVQQAMRSPNGKHVAFVEEHVYGPHFGGETPAVEVHVRSGQDSTSADGLIFQAPSEGVNVSVRWLGPDRLLVLHSESARVIPMPSTYDGVAIERAVQ